MTRSHISTALRQPYRKNQVRARNEQQSASSSGRLSLCVALCCSSRRQDWPSILTSPNQLSTLHRWYACARLSQPVPAGIFIAALGVGLRSTHDCRPLSYQATQNRPESLSWRFASDIDDDYAIDKQGTKVSMPMKTNVTNSEIPRGCS